MRWLERIYVGGRRIDIGQCQGQIIVQRLGRKGIDFESGNGRLTDVFFVRLLLLLSLLLSMLLLFWFFLLWRRGSSIDAAFLKRLGGEIERTFGVVVRERSETSTDVRITEMPLPTKFSTLRRLDEQEHAGSLREGAGREGE